MQVEVSFREMPSQKSKGGEDTKGIPSPAAACSGRGRWLFFPDTEPIASNRLLPASKNTTACFQKAVQLAAWPRKQGSYGFDQLTKKRGSVVGLSPESS